LTTEEVAAVLGVRRHSVYMAVYRGGLRKARSSRGGADFDLADVEEYSLRRYRPGVPHSYWATTGEAAELLGVTPAWLGSQVAAGRLPGVRHPSGRLLFRRAQVEVIGAARESRLWRQPL
jgi:excisionase family DNA binding protein